MPWLCNRKGLRAATELPNYALGLGTDSHSAWSCEDFQTLRHAAWKQWRASLARNGDTASIHAAPTHCSAYCVVLGGPAAAWPEVWGFLFQEMGELWLYRNSALAIVSNLKWQHLLNVYWSHMWHGLCPPPPFTRFSLEKRNFGRVATKVVLWDTLWIPQFLRDKCKELHHQIRRKR